MAQTVKQQAHEAALTKVEELWKLTNTISSDIDSSEVQTPDSYTPDQMKLLMNQLSEQLGMVMTLMNM